MLDKNVREVVEKVLRKDKKISSMVSEIEDERSNAHTLYSIFMRERQHGASVQEARDAAMKGKKHGGHRHAKDNE